MLLDQSSKRMWSTYISSAHTQGSTYPSVCEIRDYRILSFCRYSQIVQSSALKIRGHTHTYTHKILPAQSFMPCYYLWLMRSETISQPRSPSSTPFMNQVFPQLKLKLPWTQPRHKKQEKNQTWTKMFTKFKQDRNLKKLIPGKYKCSSEKQRQTVSFTN